MFMFLVCGLMSPAAIRFGRALRWKLILLFIKILRIKGFVLTSTEMSRVLSHVVAGQK